MLSVLIGIYAVTAQESRQGIDLLTNPSFSRDLEGWSKVWAREGETATVSLVDGHRPTAKGLAVSYVGGKDWAVSQEAMIPVQPGEIYQISAWMKRDGGNAEVSTVARDASGTTLEWSLGAASPQGQSWQFVKRVFVVPAKAKTLQFRFIGDGTGNAAIESPSLFKVGVRKLGGAAPVTIGGPAFRLTVRGDGGMTASSKGKTWTYRPWPDELLPRTEKRIDASTLQIDALDLANDLPLTVTIRVDRQRPEFTVSYEGHGAMDREMPTSGTLETKAGQWLVLPMNEGIRFPVDDKTIDGWSLITYGGHGLCMPWSGATDPISGAGAMTLVETPDDADFTYSSPDGRLTFQPRWEPSRKALGYPRKLRYCYFDHGGFVAMAKRYRDYAKATGLFKTLAQKRAENPNVDRLIGAVNVWNWDMDKVGLCRDMKALGMARVLWSGGGTPQEIKAIGAMGDLPGRYDIFQDVWDPKNSLPWMNTKGWPQDLVLEPSGEWMKGWSHPDRQPDGSIKWYPGGVICSGPGLTRAKQTVPEDLAKTPYLARFIDTTTASPFRECYNPLHPLTRSQDRANKMALLGFCSKEMKQVVGTETGIDPSVPVVAYYEGMMSLGPFRLPDAGTFMMEYRKPTPEFLKFQVGATYRIPLWELVYHDCTVAQWYWGDATNKAPEVWDQRDLLNILYGTAPLLMFDKTRWEKDKGRMLQTYQNVCEWTRKVGYDEMLSHQDLTPDHSVQRTTWSSGKSVIVNFGATPYEGIKPLGFRCKYNRS